MQVCQESELNPGITPSFITLAGQKLHPVLFEYGPVPLPSCENCQAIRNALSIS